MKRGQTGFTVVELLLVLILVSILGFTGYYVYHSRNNGESSSTPVNNQTESNNSWQTFNGTPVANAIDSPYQDDEIAYSLKYPSNWKFYPSGTKTVTQEGNESTNSYQEITDGKSDSSIAIGFNGVQTKLGATEYSKGILGDQSNNVGPIWKIDKSFTTKKGYTVQTVKLEASTGTVYETYVSNNQSGLVDFNYGQAVVSKYDSTLQAIFESVTIP